MSISLRVCRPSQVLINALIGKCPQKGNNRQIHRNTLLNHSAASAARNRNHATDTRKAGVRRFRAPDLGFSALGDITKAPLMETTASRETTAKSIRLV